MAQQGAPVVVATDVRGTALARAAAGVARRTLVAALDAVRTSRFGVVVGPRGSGKTTLLAQWARATGMPVLWGRCTAAGVEVRTADGSAVPLAPAVLARDVLATSAPWRDVPSVLVLDDVHELGGDAAERELERLLLDVPATVHVVVGSRRQPSIGAARSEVADPVVLTGTDLRLRPWEVDRLFRDVHAQPLAEHDVDVLVRETDGWPALVHLFHRATSALLPADRRRAVRSLVTEGPWFAREYLGGEILGALDRPLVDLLHWGAAFDVLTADRCDALRGASGARRLLRDLDRRWSLAPTDDGVHHRLPRPLRRHLLAAHAYHLGPTATAAWHRRAARVLEDDGAPGAALVAACRGGDDAAVARLLDAGAAERASAAEPGWTALLPDALQDHPAVRAALARELVRDGRFADALAAAPEDPAVRAAALTWHPTADGGTDQGSTDQGGTDHGRDVPWRSDGPSTPPWTALVRAALARNPAQAARRARTLPGAEGALAEGLCLLLAGDQRGAREPLRRAAQDPDADAAVVLAAALAATALTTAPRPSTAATLDRVHGAAAEHGLTWLARLAHGLVVGLDDTERSRAEVGAVVAADDAAGDPWGAALVASWHALVALGRGSCDPDEWEALVDRWHALGATVPEVWCRTGHALATATHQLPEAEQDARAAEAWARSAGVPGALAFAYAGLAVCAGDAELALLARATADQHGTDLPPLPAFAVRPAAAPAPRGGAPAPALRAAEPEHVPVLDVRCLGEFRLRVDGRPVDLSTVRPRARSALRFLALHAGRPVHREALADALWGDLDPAAAMHNLHVSVSAVRRALEPDVPTRSSRIVVRDGEAYTLVLAPGSTCDLVDFDAAVREGARLRASGDRDDAARAWRRALDVYAGDLLPEDGPAEWVVGPRDRVRAVAAEAACDLAQAELDAGRHDAAVAAATRSIELDECRDHAWRLLIAALTAAGDTAAAHRAHRGYRAVLDGLGVPESALAARGTPLVTSGRGTPPPRSPRGSAASPGRSS